MSTEQKTSDTSDMTLVTVTSDTGTSANPLSPEGEKGGWLSLASQPACGGQKKGGSKRATYAGTPPADGVLIATTPGWELYRRPAKSVAPWNALKLVTTSNRPCKGNFWLAHNGLRFAWQKDASSLAENEPEIYAWAHSVCVERFRAQP